MCYTQLKLEIIVIGIFFEDIAINLRCFVKRTLPIIDFSGKELFARAHQPGHGNNAIEQCYHFAALPPGPVNLEKMLISTQISRCEARNSIQLVNRSGSIAQTPAEGLVIEPANLHIFRIDLNGSPRGFSRLSKPPNSIEIASQCAVECRRS